MSLPPSRMVIWFVPPPPGIFSLASYYPLKNMTIKTPRPWEFPIIRGVGMDISRSRTVEHYTKAACQIMTFVAP